MGEAAHDPAGATLSETHISVVVCLADRAYKVKKPVAFDFVDQSTREKRLALCQHEVDRNRRISPDVYLGVADVVGPDGAVCDHLVVMRRMPEERRLSALAAQADPRVDEGLEQLARLVADFHRDAARSPEIDAAGSAEADLARWRTNAEEMTAIGHDVLPHPTVQAILERATRFLTHQAPMFAARVSEGWVCDGHGDLLAGDVFLLDDGPRVLDCIDFDDRLAYGDVASDVAFLAMDLERLGRPDLAGRWIHGYEQASGAALPRALVHHYIAYRAQVRAKVTALRAVQSGAAHDVAEARRLLEICDRHLRVAGPRLVVVGGSPGTGKTTVARALSDERGWELLRSDVVRKEAAPTDAGERGSPWRTGLYSPERTAAVYRSMVATAREHLRLGRSVVLDATFSTEDQRSLARGLAAELDCPLLELRCTLDPSERDRRIRLRQARGDDLSDADPAIAARLDAATDPWPQARALPTDGTPESVRADAVRLLDAWMAGADD